MTSGYSKMNSENAARLDRLEDDLRATLALLTDKAYVDMMDLLEPAMCARDWIESYGEKWSDTVIATHLQTAEQALAQVRRVLA